MFDKKTFTGPIVIVGFGSIGRAVLPLIHRHFTHEHHEPVIVICPDETNRTIAEEYGATFVTLALTQDNYTQVLDSYFGSDKPRGLLINVANEVSSKDLTRYAATHNAHYIDTVVEPWPGFYFNSGLSKAAQSNYALRESLHELKSELTNTPTAISCSGANPGMVSWLIKEALLRLAYDLGLLPSTPPTTQAEWAKLMSDLGVKGVQIAERDTQHRAEPRNVNEFINTWSVEGFVAEGLQPAELGWGTHEESLPHDGHKHESGCQSAIYLDTPGGQVEVETWTPTHGNHRAFLITHNEAISIADYFTLRDDDRVLYRPTCHYAYHPTDATVDSLTELFDERDGELQETISLLSEADIVSGTDELGVLLYGHPRGAFWYGSTLSIEEARALAPHQNATGLQVSSAIIASIFYLLEHPNEGLIETDEMDHLFCLSHQHSYLGTISGHYTTWQPEPKHHPDPWQFVNLRRQTKAL